MSSLDSGDKHVLSHVYVGRGDVLKAALLGWVTIAVFKLNVSFNLKVECTIVTLTYL